jgi:catechol 2,3-dioxygenase-like lactoylglutathione lyase family enzyme
MAGLTEISHVGIVVPDLEAACDDLSRALGLTWAKPAEQLVVGRSATGLTRTPVLLSWSVQGPPYVELLQGPPGTPWAAAGARRLHHVGYWVDDVAAESERLDQAGLTLEVAGEDDQGRRAEYAYHLDGSVRVEVLDRRRRRMLERWIAGR